MKIIPSLVIALIAAPFSLIAQSYTNLTITNNLNVGSSIYHRIYSFGYLQSATFVYAGSHVFGATYVQSPQGIFTNVLRSGGSTASGSLSVGLGAAANATAYSAVVVGRNNLVAAWDGSTANATQWRNEDPLFAVGNGTGVAGQPEQYRNAFTVYKDGTITMSKAQGDILMGQFGN